MDNKLSELSKPVAYSLRFRNMQTGEPDKKINANTTFSTLEKAKAYGLGTRYVTQDDGKIVNVRDPSQAPIVEPLYSQEYVSVLIQRAERLDSMLTESVQALKAAEQLNADAEVRGVEKLAAAFKSWASDETFPDYEAQRHWATASQEALSFAGDLRNGSCDDR